MRDRESSFERPDTDRAGTWRASEEETDPEVIARQIDQTRNEMTETVDAIQHRLDPERIAGQAVDAATEVTNQARDAAKSATVEARDAALEVTIEARDAAKEVTRYAIDEARTAVQEMADQATGAVRAATVGRVEQMATYTRDNAQVMGNDLMSLIRQNPVPATLAAIGIGWLWMKRSEGNGNGHAYPYAGYSGHSSSAWRDGGRSHDSGGNLVDQAQQMAGQAVHQAQQMVDQVTGQAQEMTGSIAGQTHQSADAMQYRAKSAFQGVSRDPLTMGAIGIALGAAAALLLPESEQERQLLGDAREQMKERVQQMGSEAVDRVQQAATEAGKTAMNEVMSQGSEGASSRTAAL